MTQTKFTTLFGLLVAFTLLAQSAFAQENAMQAMGKANAKVAKAASHKNHWDGPTTGPKLKSKKRVVFIAGDLGNPTTAALYKGTKEAAGIAGWELLMIDCRGACYQGAPVVNQALAMKPDGVILAGVDALTQAKGLAKALESKVAVVGWHAITKPGPVDGLFANVGSNPREAAQIAALYGVTEANTKMGMVIFTDNSTPYLSAKSSALIEIIKQCETCRLLSVEELPISEASTKMLPTVDDIVKRQGSKWTHVLAVNDAYFDFMEKPAILAIIAGNKLKGLSAGDGTAAAYQRIRSGSVQIGTVPEPANLNGWQLIDELNRAFSGVAASGYTPVIHLATDQNSAFDGGSKNMFDPDNDYREQYQKYWSN